MMLTAIFGYIGIYNNLYNKKLYGHISKERINISTTESPQEQP